MLSLLYIVTLILLAPVISGTGALTPIIVLSPKANQEFSPGQNVFFEYALIDSSVQQLDIFLDSFGTVNDEVLLKYISFDSANSDGVYTLNGRTYKKYSTNYSIPTDLSTENEAYQITFQTAVGDVLIPIKMNQPAPTSSIIAGITTTTNSENSLISTTSTSLASTTTVLATTTITIEISSVIPATSTANSNINTTTTISITPIMTTVNAGTTTTVPTGITNSTSTLFSSTVFSSTTASLVSNSNMSMMSTSSTSSIPLTAVVTTTADPQNSSYSFSISTASFYSSFINTSISKTQISSYTISQTSIEPSTITTTPSTATSIITTGTLSATYTPTPPNPDSLVLHSAATNSVKADFSIVTITLIALLLFRLLLTQ
ncbi:MAG: hypothetical protein EXX96DRAFT_576721 [Benjaminiella poitrasii]|nr:MAG: hypothetical protein EXX96DRAFT_576721 [Benjaminiella poitrasii]